MKIINARCPLQDECGRKKCAYQFRELDCPYYWANARPDSEIPDQEGPSGMKKTTDYHHVIEAALLDIAKSSGTERVKSLQAEALSELEMRLD